MQQKLAEKNVTVQSVSAVCSGLRPSLRLNQLNQDIFQLS